MNNVQVFLTRRNLLTLLEKLDHVKSGGASQCTIVKSDTVHPTHPIVGADNVRITAVEDEDYYTDRTAGDVLDLNTGETK